ncbi:putative sulfate exporter family transporter [Aquisalimonas sp.]|uniref:putative sulfate exporter family transporter n=1 Tax=Aquisalimonas sp. TaxID=1872621 RepID=UPI0025C48D32|nr:putative sulfate exporter family transporter [Aquisalimonas sp.]
MIANYRTATRRNSKNSAANNASRARPNDLVFDPLLDLVRPHSLLSPAGHGFGWPAGRDTSKSGAVRTECAGVSAGRVTFRNQCIRHLPARKSVAIRTVGERREPRWHRSGCIGPRAVLAPDAQQSQPPRACPLDELPPDRNQASVAATKFVSHVQWVAVYFCAVRRTSKSAARLVDNVCPEQPVRQRALNIRYPLRFSIQSRPAVTGRVSGLRAGDAAAITKLLRVAVLTPIVVLLALLWRGETTGSAPVPLFLVAFLALVAVNSLGLLDDGPVALARFALPHPPGAGSPVHCLALGDAARISASRSGAT